MDICFRDRECRNQIITFLREQLFISTTPKVSSNLRAAEAESAAEIGGKTSVDLQETVRNEIANMLRDFFLLNRCFTLSELIDFEKPQTDEQAIREALVNDERFVALNQQTPEEIFFVPEPALFRWFTHITLRLAQAGLARLSARHLAISMSSLRLDGKWDVVPAEAVDFGHRFGFIACALTPNEYVFPLAWFLSRLSPLVFRTAASILETFSESSESTYATTDQDMILSLDKILSQFDSRTVKVIQERHGLVDGKKKTLKQLSSHLGVSRERVRQLERDFWNSSKPPPGFIAFILTALLREIIHRSGSLVVSGHRFLIEFIDACMMSKLLRGSSSLPKQEWLERFLANYVAIPYLRVLHSELFLLGALPRDIASMKSMKSFDSWTDSTDANIIAQRLEREGRLCISATDLKTVCEVVADLHRKRLTKSQRVYIVLRSIGKPAHYSKVTEEYNRLFPQDPVSEHNIHAILSRQEHGVVWIGIRGAFALREWGFERPTKKLFDSVTEIVRLNYNHTSKPVPFTVISAEIGKYRRAVNPNSLIIAAGTNPDLKRVSKDCFVPRDALYQVQADVSADEIDKVLRDFQKKTQNGTK